MDRTGSYVKTDREARAYDFRPERYERELRSILTELEKQPVLDDGTLYRVARRHPKDGARIWSKGELIRGLRHLARLDPEAFDSAGLTEKLRMKPTRTLSGVTPVTVLTQPFPCPGECVFCPSDVRMPKSYLAEEPGAQRAARLGFDPYRQTFERLRALHNIGHRVDKVELIILGGTWSSYPESYRLWFVRRLFEALNDFDFGGVPGSAPQSGAAAGGSPSERVDGRSPAETYNQVVARYLRQLPGPGFPGWEPTSWEQLAQAQERNEAAAARCVGLAVETRPDHVSAAEVIGMRRMGATKVQIGYQSLSDRVLRLNRRGHDVAATRRATALLRRAGFKIHAHWMPNLYGSTPAQDRGDFQRLFGDPDFRPDELKIYPCSLIESAELMQFYERGEWRPYSQDQLLEVLTDCLRLVPPYCRITRVIRDIPSHQIVAGNRRSNFRELAERALAAAGGRCRDIRSREIRGQAVQPQRLRLTTLEYQSSAGRECFLQFVSGGDRLVGFLRLTLPHGPGSIAELERSALIREVHVYGAACAIGEHSRRKSQHLGLGRRLIQHAARRARAAGYPDLAVISAVGTRNYYRRLRFVDGELYQHRALE